MNQLSQVALVLILNIAFSIAGLWFVYKDHFKFPLCPPNVMVTEPDGRIRIDKFPDVFKKPLPHGTIIHYFAGGYKLETKVTK